MGFQLPNPPSSGGSASKVETGLQTLLFAAMNPYSNTLSYSTGAPGMTTTTGTLFNATRDPADKVKSIPRECRYANVGAAGTTGWNQGVTPANPFAIAFPGPGLNNGGFRLTIVGGLDSDISTLVNTSFGFGFNSFSAAFPAPGAALNAAGAAWFGIYSEEGSNNINYGYKNFASGIVSLGSFPLTWAVFQGMRAIFTVSPIDLSTTYELQLLTGVGQFTTVASGSITGFNPGNVPVAPWFAAYKNEIPNFLQLWCSGWTIINYPYGRASV